MKKYYYHNGADKFGPYTVEELKAQGITPKTKVWAEGMADWADASTVAELGIESTPNIPPITPIPPEVKSYKAQIPPSSNLVWAILTTILCCLPLGIVAIIYAAKVESTYYSGNEVMAREYSKLAARWSIISAISAAVVVVIYFISIMCFAGAAIYI